MCQNIYLKVNNLMKKKKKYKKSHLPRPTLQTFVNVQNEMWANIDTK